MRKEDCAAAEGILFAAGCAVECDKIADALNLSSEETREVMQSLQAEYEREKRGLRIITLGSRYQMTSAPECASVIRSCLSDTAPAKLSKPALEVLCIIAYYQPVTKLYIDKMRGVDSSYTLGYLIDREFAEECGSLDAPGRPLLYRTTEIFLRTFGLQSLQDLPPLPEEGQEEERELISETVGGGRL